VKKSLYIAWIAGFALFLGIVAYGGFSDMASALASVGWGLLAVSAVYPVTLVPDVLCWRLLLHGPSRPSYATLYWRRWIGDAVNFLLPSAQVGGELVRARLIALRGVPGPEAGASVAADLTIAVATEALFTLPGLLLLIHYGGVAATTAAAAAGTLVIAFLALVFYLAQRAGFFLRGARLVERLVPAKDWEALVGGAEALEASLAAIYGRRRVLVAAGLLRLLGWLMGTLEVWLALRFLGHPVGVGQALMLESLGQAIRHAIFFIPGGLGVQEGGFILLGSIIGIGPETGLALSLVKRVRELLTGLPALVAWQIIEGRRHIRRRPT
jgi:putative membrane protein